MLLICRCGQKLNTPGATPGRVGKCPRCGTLLKVDAPAATPVPAAAPAEVAARSALQADPPSVVPPTYRRPAPASRRPTRRRPIWADGLVAIPTTPERSFLVCLSYPFRNAAGMALLVFIPPLIWFGSVPLFGLIPMVRGGSQLTLFALILTGPPLVVLFFALGHALLFLGDVVVTSCLGAVILPRPASWDPGDIVRAWALWVWALVVGGCVGAWPALLYWFRCGDVDWFDQVVLIDLIMPGLAYGQLALVLALTEDSPWSAANPLRVMGTIWRGGWTLLWPCLVTGVFLVLAIGLLVRCLELGNDLMQAVAFWAWWVLGLYLAMVALRWLGLFCYRSRVIAISPRRVRQQS